MRRPRVASEGNSGSKMVAMDGGVPMACMIRGWFRQLSDGLVIWKCGHEQCQEGCEEFRDSYIGEKWVKISDCSKRNTIILLLLIVQFFLIFQIVCNCWSYSCCVLVCWCWDQCRLLEEWSYGWTYSGYFDHALGWLGGRIVGRGDVLSVWVVTECRSGDGRVKKWSYKG